MIDVRYVLRHMIGVKVEIMEVAKYHPSEKRRAYANEAYCVVCDLPFPDQMVTNDFGESGTVKKAKTVCEACALNRQIRMRSYRNE
jgi:hypothetical protein